MNTPTNSEASPLTNCSPSSDVDTAPEQWRSQCLVARIQRDEALKSAERAKAYKRVMKLKNQKMKRQLAAAMDVISAIEERYIDGCDTYEDWKFMGDNARTFLQEKKIIPSTGANEKAND